MAERQEQMHGAAADAMGARVDEPDPQEGVREEYARPGKSPRRVLFTLSAVCVDVTVCLPPCCAAGILRACALAVTDLGRTRLEADDFALVSLAVNDGSLDDCVFFVLGYGRSPADFLGTIGREVGGTGGGIWGRRSEVGKEYRELCKERNREAGATGCSTEQVYGSLRSSENKERMRGAEGEVWGREGDGAVSGGLVGVC